MDTKKAQWNSHLPLFLISCIVVISTSSLLSCRKVTGCVTERTYNEYLVEIPISLFPANDTFNVGDTIWIEQIFQDQLFDQRNNMSLDFSDYSFGNWIVISDLLNPYDFSLKHSQAAVIGKLSQVGTGSMKIGYIHERDTFKFKMQIVITKKGLFNIGFLAQNKEANFSRCAVENLDLRFNLNGKGDNNYHMMKYSSDSLTREASKEVYDQIGSYCFFVR